MADVQREGAGAPLASADETHPVGLAGEPPGASGGVASGGQPPASHVEERKGPPFTRASATWTALAVGLAFLVVVLVFILENLQKVKVTFFGAHWRAPLAVDLLLAAVLGGLVVFMTGTLRILQLRRHARRERSRTAAGLTGEQR